MLSKIATFASLKSIHYDLKEKKKKRKILEEKYTEMMNNESLAQTAIPIKQNIAETQMTSDKKQDDEEEQKIESIIKKKCFNSTNTTNIQNRKNE